MELVALPYSPSDPYEIETCACAAFSLSIPVRLCGSSSSPLLPASTMSELVFPADPADWPEGWSHLAPFTETDEGGVSSAPEKVPERVSAPRLSSAIKIVLDGVNLDECSLKKLRKLVAKHLQLRDDGVDQ